MEMKITMQTVGGIFSISIKRIVSVSVCLNAFAQFSRYRAETLQVSRGLPGIGRGRVKIVGMLLGGGGEAGEGTRRG